MKSTRLILTTAIGVLFLTACGNTLPPEEVNRAYLGNIDATILVEEFADLQCPACGTISPQVADVVQRNSDIAKLVYYHFPLPQHEHAFMAAEASECANDQGRFWDYLHETFKVQAQLGRDQFSSIAGRLGLNMDPFNLCLDNRDKKARVTTDLYEGRRRQVNSTPTIFINGEPIRWSGAEAFEGYLKTLASQL